MARETKTARLMRLAHRGLVTAKEVTAAGIPRAYLQRLRDRGQLEQIDRGLYRVPNTTVSELHTLAAVAKRAPNVIVCLLSALQVHRLTTEVPHAVWILIDRHARAPKFQYPNLEVVRASGAGRAHGVETRRIDGVAVKITSPSKTVADCFRYRRHVGLDVALSALRDYLARPRQPERRQKVERDLDLRAYTIDALVAAARADRVYGVMRPYLEALA